MQEQAGEARRRRAQTADAVGGGVCGSGCQRRRCRRYAGEGTEVPGPQAGLLAKRVVYFDFDSSEIKGEGTDIVARAREVPR